MIHKDSMGRPEGISNNLMNVVLDYQSGFRIKRWQHRGIDENATLPAEIFEVEIEDKLMKSNHFDVQRTEAEEDLTQELISVYLRCGEVRCRVCLIHEKAEETLRFIIQLAVDWPDGIPQEVYLRLPFLAEFRFRETEDPVYLSSGDRFSKKDGGGIIQQHRDFPLPLGVMDKDGLKGFAVEFPALNHSWGWSQKRNIDLGHLKTLEPMKRQRILVRPNAFLTDIFEFKFTAVTNGWVELFNDWRERMRAPLDLSEYQRKDLSWSKDVFLPHFTFAFGKEAYDYDKQCMDIDRLIQEGKAFGGYDAIILWHQYPRLGVDQRTQWDFYDDFPGGIRGLRATVDRAHQLGIKVFLPFKPWDAGYDESPKGATERIKQLVADTDIDGIFLDTMESVPRPFREAIDSVKTGVVFCSEMHPNHPQNIKLITQSWDQYWSNPSMPEINLFRFVLPEHTAPMSSRFHVGVKKDMLIQRAVFNGTGIVVWQDIFGSWLPYSETQKQVILKWKKIWQENKLNFTGSKPVPLYPCLPRGVYCNLFPADDGASVIYVFYNDNELEFSGDLAVHADPNLRRLDNLWSLAAVGLAHAAGKEMIQGTIPRRSILIILAKS